jgi:hypothetical protein
MLNGWIRWCIPIITVLRILREEDQEFETSWVSMAYACNSTREAEIKRIVV